MAASIEEYLLNVDELAQQVINAWGGAASTGHANDLTPEFDSLFEKACLYRDFKRIADNHRQFGVLSEQEAAEELEYRQDFAQAYKILNERADQ
jgi:hypothetical protein